MNTIEVISKEDYLATIPLIIHNYITNELQFQLQTIISEEHLVYCRHIETMAIFIQPDIEINAAIIPKEDIILFMVAMNLKVIKMLTTFEAYINYKTVSEDQIRLLTNFMQSDFFTEVQKLKLKNLILLG
ncbi:hypothetical protein [Gilliamella apis]|uniref:Uncharacterized protein n=1 Tax=Gilliamella apis TaxID=1970738 RepID=A0A242NX48_9GAMM|nr:hypothetical protein [Gilliamella apis]OTQ52716.1 hypothetical protein B6D06_01715 [Gilliamella apis]